MQIAQHQRGIRGVGTRRKKSLDGLYSGKVIDIHPKTSSVDVKLFSGDTLRGVRVLFNSANTAAGFRYLASIKNVAPRQTPAGKDDVPTLGHQADTIAIVAFLDGNVSTPRVVGFDYPVDSQMHLDEAGLSVNLHESGIYHVMTAAGHYETHYPDGSYVIYGPDTTPKDMSSIQGNGQRWEPKTTPPMQLTVSIANGFLISVANGVMTINNGTKEASGKGDTVSVDISGTTSDGATFNATGTGTITSGNAKILI